MKKTLLASALTLWAMAAPAAEQIEAIVARVGDRIITRSQYIRRLQDGLAEIQQTLPPEQAVSRSAEFKKNLMNDLLSELLIKDRADRLGLTVAAAEVEEAVKRLKTQYGLATDDEFVDSLKKSGMTRTEMESRLRDSLLTNKVFARELRSRDELSDKELRQRYDRERDTFRLPERARVREIVILKPEDPAAESAARSKAESAATRAKAGEAFDKLAKELSDSPTKEKGGEMGEIARGELLVELDRAVFNLSVAGVAGPIETRSAFHVLKVDERLPSEIPSFESVKEKLRKDASEETFQRDYKAYIDRLRSEAFVQIHEKNVPST